MEKNVSIREIRKFLSPRSDLDVLRIYYCYQIGSTFTNLGLMESRIITAMATCDAVRLSKVLEEDVPAWKHVIERHDHLQASTLGNLIAILSKHNIVESDLSYLKWVKAKRDFFIHRFFGHYAWPGDLSDRALRIHCRRLRYLEWIFVRANSRVYKIFSRAGLVEYTDLGQDGALIINVGAVDGDNAWIKDFAIAAVRDRARTQRKRKTPA